MQNTFLPGFGNGFLKYCAIVQLWGGQQNILRMIPKTYQECFDTTLYLIRHIPLLLGLVCRVLGAPNLHLPKSLFEKRNLRKRATDLSPFSYPPLQSWMGICGELEMRKRGQREGCKFIQMRIKSRTKMVKYNPYRTHGTVENKFSFSTIPWVAIVIYIMCPPSRNSRQSRLFQFPFVYFC